MATILAYTSPALGNLLPMAALLAELQGRGHRIVLRTHAAGVSTVAALGFDAAPIDPRIESIEMTDWMASNPMQALRMAFEVFGRRGGYEVDDLRATLDEVSPDALLVDPNCWGASALAGVSSLPWLAFWPFTPFLPSRGTPPFGPGLPPWPGRLGRLRDALLRPLVTGTFEKTILGPLNSVCAAAGAAPVATAEEFLRRAPLMLVATAEPFEYPHPDWGDAVQLIGACEYEPPSTVAMGWLDEVDAPVVLVTTSSEHQKDHTLGTSAMEALADEPVHVVATFPSGVPDGLDVPSNATALRFVPHGALLDRAVCAVTHGGMGATQKALARGVPVCVVPFGRDQLEVARRVQVSRSGTRLPAKRLTAPRLKAKVLQAMSMTDGAQRVAAGLAAAGGVSRGADLIEQRLLKDR
jgi:UDP:flavonoid glycosyltransferase YjiC (YdhE family)